MASKFSKLQSKMTVDRQLRNAAAAEAIMLSQRALKDAYAQLLHWWYLAGSCPCGARADSLATHGHVIGCPTEIAIREKGPQERHV